MCNVLNIMCSSVSLSVFELVSCLTVRARRDDTVLCMPGLRVGREANA